jgi:hypothetical protein
MLRTAYTYSDARVQVAQDSYALWVDFFAPVRSGTQVRELRISLAALHTTCAIAGRKVRRPGVVSSCKPCPVLVVILSVPKHEITIGCQWAGASGVIGSPGQTLM